MGRGQARTEGGHTGCHSAVWRGVGGILRQGGPRAGVGAPVEGWEAGSVCSIGSAPLKGPVGGSSVAGGRGMRGGD